MKNYTSFIGKKSNIGTVNDDDDDNNNYFENIVAELFPSYEAWIDDAAAASFAMTYFIRDTPMKSINV